MSLCLRESLSKAGDLKGDLHDTPWVESVEALEVNIMPVVRAEVIATNFV